MEQPPLQRMCSRARAPGDEGSGFFSQLCTLRIKNVAGSAPAAVFAKGELILRAEWWGQEYYRQRFWRGATTRGYGPVSRVSFFMKFNRDSQFTIL
jgi:hypothetical protein